MLRVRGMFLSFFERGERKEMRGERRGEGRGGGGVRGAKGAK